MHRPPGSVLSAGPPVLYCSNLPKQQKYPAQRTQKIAGLAGQLRLQRQSWRTRWEVGTRIHFPTAQLTVEPINKAEIFEIFEGRRNMQDMLGQRNCLLFPIIILNHQSCLPNDMMSKKKRTNRIYLVGQNFMISILMVFYCQ